MQKIAPFFWFDDNTDFVAEFYLSVFPHAGKLKVQRSQGTCPWPACQIGTIPIEILLHGGPAHKLTPAFSFFIRCDSQQEIDSYWSTLLEGSNPKVCGWLTGRFGLSWQIVPPQACRADHASQDHGSPDRHEQAGHVCARSCRTRGLKASTRLP